ncbi:MAG: GGDEF domain-containing protein, partial [Actinobacteria bacterium]|nr:GGDEF domain-containing protein [Actinomycetota bacterium]
FIDLDRFKQVNDTLGHAAGDELIQQVAARLGSRLRQSDTLGRLGGDEYVALLPQATPEGAGRVADDLRAALSQPFQLAAGTVTIGGSIGLATAPLDGTDYDTLLRTADHAMYRAKADRGTTATQPV